MNTRTWTPSDLNTNTKVGTKSGHLEIDQGDSSGSREVTFTVKNLSGAEYAEADGFVEAGESYDRGDNRSPDIRGDAENVDRNSEKSFSLTLDKLRTFAGGVSISGAYTDHKARIVIPENRNATAVVEEDDVVYSSGNASFSGKTIGPFFTSASTAAVTKMFGSAPHIFSSVTVNADTREASYTVTVSSPAGGSRSVSSAGTFDLSGLNPAPTASVSVSFSSTGQNTPYVHSISVDAEPAVQVYTGGQWQYKPISLVSGSGHEVPVTDVAVYDGGWT